MSRMSNSSWIWLLAIVGIVDFVQLVIIECILVWFFGVGAVINEILDPFVGISIAGYLMKKDVHILTKPNRFMALCVGEAAAAISAGVAQFWILSVWYIRNDVRKEEAMVRAAQEQERFMQTAARVPAYQNGRREPLIQSPLITTEFNRSGSRRPHGNQERSFAE